MQELHDIYVFKYWYHLAEEKNATFLLTYVPAFREENCGNVNKGINFVSDNDSLIILLKNIFFLKVHMVTEKSLLYKTAGKYYT